MVRKCIYVIDTTFFSKWNSKMTYILGFAFSDGSINKRTLSWHLQKHDKKLLIKINRAMKSNYPLKFRKRSVRLRISNPSILANIKQLGLTPNKTKTMGFPDIPKKFLRHFIRGVLDGDGWICVDPNNLEISVGFSSGSYEFMRELVRILDKCLKLTTTNVRKKRKKKKDGKISWCYEVEWYAANAFKIIKFLYDDLKKYDLFLERKHEKQLKAREAYRESRVPKRWRKIEHKFNMPMKKLLQKLLIEEKLNGVQIAERLNVHSSSIYRWLAKTKVRLPSKKSREIIITKCSICNRQIKQQRTHLLKYCSSRCRSRARQTGEIVKCTVCGKRIYRAEWWFKVNNNPFCSRTCIGRWQTMRLHRNLLLRSKINGRFLTLISK